MDKEKEMTLQALCYLVANSEPRDEEQRKLRLGISKRIAEALNPKEVVPYEDSLEVCADCEKTKGEHIDNLWCHKGIDGQGSSADWKKFVSSKLNSERGS